MRAARLLLLLSSFACQKDRDGDGVADPVLPTGETGTPGTGVHPGVTSVDLAVPSNFQEALHFGHFTRGRSCTVADFDLDGLQDIMLGNPSDESYILRNASSGPGDVRFEVMTVLIDTVDENTSLSWVSQAADYDNDGDFDVFVGMGGIEGHEFNHLFRNELVPTGTVAFTDVAEQAGVLGPKDDGVFQEGANGGAVWADFDNDAHLDLYVSQDVYPLRSYDRLRPGDWAGYDLMFANNGDGTFTEVGRSVGLDTQEPTRHSSVADLDNDGDLDIYENNFTKFQYVWRNQMAQDGVPRFVDVTAQSALDGGDMFYPLETFTSATADLNNDGWEDVIAFVRGYATQGPYALGHTIFLNVEGRGFVDATGPSNVNNPFEPGLRDHGYNGVMGASPTDVTGDGLVDIYVGNGGPETGQASQLFVAKELAPVEFPGVGTVMVPVYENWTDLIAFPAEEDPAVIAAGIEYPPFPYRTHGICVVDFDHDGVREIAVQEGGTFLWGGTISQEPNRLYQIQMPEPQGWLAVHPVGDGVNVSRDAIGTRLHAVLEAPDGSERHVHDTLRGGNGFSASNGFEVFLGLGDAVAIRSLDILWPDGELDVMMDVEMNQLLQVTR